MKKPNSRRNLDAAILRAFGTEREALHARNLMANAIVGQMLPNGVIKGGSALSLRFGDAGTRFTSDLDAARAEALDEFVERLGASLADGWEGFTGRVVALAPAHPKDVPPHYVMQPFEVKLSYNGKSWFTVRLEVGHNEIGDADVVEYGLAEDVAGLFEKVGLPCPGPSPLMPLHHQIAQKVHGATEPGSRRAHDLIDLQLIVGKGDVDYGKTKETCIRLFNYRQMQAWPPTVVENEGWDELYRSQLRSDDVLSSVDEAVGWANELIARICESK